MRSPSLRDVRRSGARASRGRQKLHLLAGGSSVEVRQLVAIRRAQCRLDFVFQRSAAAEPAFTILDRPATRYAQSAGHHFTQPSAHTNRQATRGEQFDFWRFAAIIIMKNEE